MKINRRPDRMLPRTLAILAILCLCDCSEQKDQKETERYILESDIDLAVEIALERYDAFAPMPVGSGR